MRVLIADDEPLIRGLLSHALEAEADFEVVAVTGSAHEAIDAAASTLPDIALLDVNMPGGGGPTAARGIRERSSRTKIIALSGAEHAPAVRAMLDAGADSYLLKGMPLDELTEHLRTVGGPVGGEEGPTSPPHVATRLLIAEDDPRVLSALTAAADAAPELELVGLAQTPFHAVSLAARHLPDVALVDVLMPGGGGARIAAEIRSCSPNTRIVPFSGHGSHESVLAMIRAGNAQGDDLSADVLRQLLARLTAAEGRPVDGERRARIQRVLERRALRMVFQPIETLTGERPVGFEALARFESDPVRTPDVWFAEAADVGLGLELELLAVEVALKSINDLPPDMFVAVNVSPAAAGSDAVRDLIEPHASRILLEITEHAAVTDYGELVRRLRELREMGTRLAVDDCGAGFASLRHVLLLDPEFIKLDVALCRDLTDPMRRALTRALVSFAAETGRDVIAEGIETESDLQALRGLGVAYGQGYLLGAPRALTARAG